MQLVQDAKSRYEKWKSEANIRRIRRIPNDMEWGKRIFSNPTPFTEQLRGRFFKLRAGLGGTFGDASGEGRKSRKAGYRKLNSIAPPATLAQVYAALDRVLAQPRKDDFYFKDTLATRQLQFAVDEVPELRQLLTPKLLDAVRDYYGTNFQLLNISAWRNWHIPPSTMEDEAYSNNWHTDCRRIDMLKVFVLPREVSEDDGPTHVLSREWTHQVVRLGYKHRRDYQLPIETIENPAHLVKLTGPAGTALLCNTNLCFHRAGVPGPGRYRDIVEIRFIASPQLSLDMPANEAMAWRDRIAQ